MELHAAGLRSAGIAVRVVYVEDGFKAPAALTRRLPGLALLAPLLADLRRELPDVVNVHTLAAPAWIAAGRSGLHRSRVVVMSYAADERGWRRGGTPLNRLRRRALVAAARWAFPRANGIWCVNEEDAAFYEREYRVSRNRLVVIPHAIEPTFFEEIPVERNWRQLLFVGTLIRRKGADVLAKAASSVMAKDPRVTLVVAGCLEEGHAFLACLPERLRTRVSIFPRVDDRQLRELYGSSGLLLVPSRLEGLPFSLLEAMAGGCPALAAANSGMLDVVQSGRTGWLLEGHDPDVWASRIIELLEHPDGLRKGGEGARAAAEAFKVEPLTARAMAWYGSLS